MINCHASSLALELKDLTDVTIQNCTFGDWTFKQVQNIFIENIKNVFDEGFLTSLNFLNSSALMQNMMIEHENLNGHLEGIFVQDFSILHIEHSNFMNNTVKYGIIKVLNFSNLIMSNCSVLGNYAEEDGAVIYVNESFIYLRNTYLQNNKANGAGGAIFAETRSRLQIENCTFSNNEANQTGGAIHLAYFSEVDLFNVSFSRNIANIGGAMYLTDNSTLNANSLSASQNRALFGVVIAAIGSCNFFCQNCFLSENNVGYTEGAAIQISNNSMVIVSDLKCLRQMGNLYSCIYAEFDCTVSVDNSTLAMNNGSVIFLSSNSHLITVSSKFVNNLTPEYGGAILSTDNSFLDVSYSLFEGNKAIVGGAIFQNTSVTKLNQCLFLGNSDSALVGNANSEVSIKNCDFENNVGQRFSGAVSMLNHTVINVSNTTFKNNRLNSTINLNGQQIYRQAVYKNTTVTAGAAIWLFQSVGNISKSVFYNNSASFWGGTISILANSLLSISHTTFENNVAGLFGGAIISNHSFLNIEHSDIKNNSVLNKETGIGGSFYLMGNSTIKISSVLFSECHAKYGGAIVANFSTIIMINSSLTSNTGSAIYLLDGVFADINNCTFSNNSTPDDGGAITCQYYCDMKMVNSNFSKNRAVAGGGAVSVSRSMSKFSVRNCSFTSNSAYSGGALSVSHSYFSISDSNFSNNMATEGGVLELAGNVSMTNCRIIDNTAHAFGGVVKSINGSLQMSNCLASNNSVKSNGGVIYSTGSIIFITNCIFKMNSALGLGGVFFVGEGTTLVRNSSFVRNFAELSGGVFIVLHSVINITQSYFFENQAKRLAGILVSKFGAKAIICETEISHNAIGAIIIDDNSVLELNGSHVANNHAPKDTVGALSALSISNSSLLIAFNSSFKRNGAYQHDSTISSTNSTAYLEKCIFMENFLTSYGGTISIEAAILKVANTFFTHNTGYDIYFDLSQDHFMNRLETYRCLFKHDNFSLKSNMDRFEQIAVRENIISNINSPLQVHTAVQKTPYASSKMFIYLPQKMTML